MELTSVQMHSYAKIRTSRQILGWNFAEIALPDSPYTPRLACMLGIVELDPSKGNSLPRLGGCRAPGGLAIAGPSSYHAPLQNVRTCERCGASYERTAAASSCCRSSIRELGHEVCDLSCCLNLNIKNWPACTFPIPV